MKDIGELIEKLYEDGLASVAETYGDTELRARFSSYMMKRYQGSIQLLSKHPTLASALLEDWYQTEMRHWGARKEADKYARFTPDVNFEEIELLSGEIYALAKSVLSGDKAVSADPLQNEMRLKRMEELLDSVFPANRAEAEHLLSESVLDAAYVASLSDKKSFRLTNAARYLNCEESK